MVEPIRVIEGKAAPLKVNDVDTDQIIPAQFLKLLSRKGLGKYAFYRWRYNEDGTPKPGFILDDPRFKDAEILIAGKNFGIGSSRENAVWALLDLGIRCVIAPSFGDIFYNNAAKNGLLCIRLPEDLVERLQDRAMEGDLILRIDLEKQEISGKDIEAIRFDIEPHVKERLLKGLDDITMALLYEEEIKRYEERMPSYIIPKPSRFLHE